MTHREFADRLAAHGTELRAWPPAAARAGRACLLRSAACRRLYVQALETDPALQDASLAPSEAARLGELCARLAHTRQAAGGYARLRGAALAGCILVGLLAGWYSAAAPRAAPLVYAAVDLTPFTGSGE